MPYPALEEISSSCRSKRKPRHGYLDKGARTHPAKQKHDAGHERRWALPCVFGQPQINNCLSF